MTFNKENILSPLTKPTNEADRKRLIQDIAGSWAIEGQEPTKEEMDRYAKYASGELSSADLVARAKAN
jgi:Antitoxin VbhA